MTTPHERLREAADIVGFVGAKDSYIDWAVSDKQRAAFQLAANTLRAIADAQSDAGKAWTEWWNEPAKDGERYDYKSCYLAGHAQGAANLAAQSSTLEAKAQLWPTSDYYEMRDLLKEICFKRDIAVDIDLLEKAKELLE